LRSTGHGAAAALGYWLVLGSLRRAGWLNESPGSSLARCRFALGGLVRWRSGRSGPRADHIAWWWCLGHRTPKPTQTKWCSNKCVPRACQQFLLRVELAALSPVGEYPQGLGTGSSLVPCVALSGEMCPWRHGSPVIAAPLFTIRCRSGRRGPRADHIACGGAWGIGFEGGPAKVIQYSMVVGWLAAN